MVRLRYAVMAVVLGISVMGCTFSRYSVFHCDECDDFPMPAYGPGYSMMPGTYTGPAVRGSLESDRPASSTPSSGSNPAAAQPDAPSRPVTSPTPPAAPVVTPGQGAAARQPAAGGTDSPSTVVTGAELVLPSLPSSARNDLPVPVAASGAGALR